MKEEILEQMTLMGTRAVQASRGLIDLTARRKNSILMAMADELERQKDSVIAANKKDITEAVNAGIASAMIDRLTLNDSRFAAMVKGIRSVADLRDPIGTRISRWIRGNGLEILKQRVPIGVIAIIYESRPNVTADAAALCFKTSNAVILRGGSEAINSNFAIATAMIAGGRKKGLPEDAIQLVKTTDRDAVEALIQLEGKVDLAIPRGGEALIRAITEKARIPVIKHYKGVCHIYVEASANQDMALKIIENAKCQRPGVCNAVEKVLVHTDIASTFIPKLAALMTSKNVELRGDAQVLSIVPDIKPAVMEDWTAEYLNLVLTVGVVSSTSAAIEHINTNGSKHSDAIITENPEAEKEFAQKVDSSSVYINASTRFTDGGEFGMGAEIGISTDKLHCRGPMGLEELTTYKYVIHGAGQVRE